MSDHQNASTQDSEEAALTWARARARGPLRQDPGVRSAGLLCLREPTSSGGIGDSGSTASYDGAGDDGEGARHDQTQDRADWLLPVWPDNATPAVLSEYDLPGPQGERAGETRRVLATCLCRCWDPLDGDPWPGRTASIGEVVESYLTLSRGEAQLHRRWSVGALRRLHHSGWLLLDEPRDQVRLGPRVATWPEETLPTLRELCRRLRTRGEEPR